MKLRLRKAIDRYNERRMPGEEELDQRRLAGRVGVTEGIVSKHVNGHVVPSTPTLLKYAEVLDVPVQELFCDASDMQGAA